MDVVPPSRLSQNSETQALAGFVEHFVAERHADARVSMFFTILQVTSSSLKCDPFGCRMPQKRAALYLVLIKEKPWNFLLS